MPRMARSRTDDVIAAHRAAGREFVAGGVRSFVREQGDGDPVVLLHGVPTSSFLYRKLLDPLAAAGLRPVAFDYPGLGLAERPDDFDYSWSGLASWTADALDALEIERCHLVVHDIAGPIGCEWAVRNPERVLSLTALNTMLNLADFRRPWPMRPFASSRLGPLYLRSANGLVMTEFFYRWGLADRSATPRHELAAHYQLLRHSDGGRAFLRIMRGFELTEAKQRLLWDGLAKRTYPAQVVWGPRDPALGDLMDVAVRVLAVEEPILLEAKHFPQEDQAPAVAEAVAAVASGGPGTRPPAGSRSGDSATRDSAGESPRSS
jgi:haloalkane dehalogenase